MADLTVIYLTVNKLPEFWMKFQLEHLYKAIDKFPVIYITRLPMKCLMGTCLIQEEEPSAWNVYKQMLRGAKLATTPYIAVAEDDTLYTREHFTEYRPALDTVCYDMSRWSVFSWAEVPVYSMRRRRGNFSMIAPTELLVEALEERMAKHPKGHHRAGEVGRHDVERTLGVTLRNAEDWYCSNPIVNLCHPFGLSPAKLPGRRKRLGEMKAYDIPYWGRAADIAGVFNGL